MTTFKVNGATLQIAQWIDYETIEDLTTAIQDKGITLDPQLVWNALQEVK